MELRQALWRQTAAVGLQRAWPAQDGGAHAGAADGQERRRRRRRRPESGRLRVGTRAGLAGSPLPRGAPGVRAPLPHPASAAACSPLSVTDITVSKCGALVEGAAPGVGFARRAGSWAELTCASPAASCLAEQSSAVGSQHSCVSPAQGSGSRVWVCPTCPHTHSASGCGGHAAQRVYQVAEQLRCERAVIPAAPVLMVLCSAVGGAEPAAFYKVHWYPQRQHRKCSWWRCCGMTGAEPGR